MTKFATSAHGMNSIIREICFKYIPFERYFEIKNMYEDPSRHYHNWKHVLHVAFSLSKGDFNKTDFEILMISAFLHDAVYDTHSKTNEYDSAQLVDEFDLPQSSKDIIKDIILATTYRDQPSDTLINAFMDADLDIFNQSESSQLEFEKQIFKEYYWVSIKDYVPARIKILENLKEKFGCKTDFLVSYLKTKKWNVGFYPGTFYPFHIGHQSVLTQSEHMFDKIIIGFGNISDKTSFRWNMDKYGELNQWVYDNYETVPLEALITDNIAELRRYSNITIIRGLRNSTDLIYEQNYLQALRDLLPDVTVAYFMTDPKLAHVSSSLIRDLLKLSPKDAYKYYNNDALCKIT